MDHVFAVMATEYKIKQDAWCKIKLLLGSKCEID